MGKWEKWSYDIDACVEAYVRDAMTDAGFDSAQRDEFTEKFYALPRPVRIGYAYDTIDKCNRMLSSMVEEHNKNLK